MSDEDTALTVGAATGLLANDTEGGQGSASLSAIMVEATANGTLVLHADGSFNYTPDADFSGFDSFLYRVTDGVNISQSAYVVLDVRRVLYDEVVALDDTAEFEASSPVSGDVLLNDTDYTHQGVSVSLDVGPTHGTVALASSGAFTYTPAAGSDLADSFKYRVTNSAGKAAGATVLIQAKVAQGNYREIAQTAGYSIPANAPNEVEVVFNSETDNVKKVDAVKYKAYIRTLINGNPLVPASLLIKAALLVKVPNSHRYLNRFLDRVGAEQAIDIESFLEVKSARDLRTQEVIRAQQFSETLAIGQHKIESTNANLTGIESSENQDWGKAVGRYHSWGRGTVTVTDAGDGRRKYVLVHEYVVRDRYNFNPGDEFDLVVIVKANDLNSLVKCGLAKNFDVLGSVETTFEWTK